jgi:hypothetical protein
MSDLRQLVERLERQGAVLERRRRHVIVSKDGRQVTVLPGGLQARDGGRHALNSRAALRRAGFEV